MRVGVFAAIAAGAASSVVAACSLTSTNGLAGGSDAGGVDVASLLDSAASAEDAGTADAAPDRGAVDASIARDAEASDAPLQSDGDAATETSADASPEADAPSPAYRATVLADSPLAYWRFGESTGTVAHDETGNGNNATIGTGVTWGAPGALIGDTNTAIALAGTQGLNAGNVFAFPGTLPYSLEAWVNVSTALDTNFRHLFSEDDETADAGREEYGVYLQVNDGLTFERFVAGKAVKVFATAPPLNQWTYVVSIYDGASMTLYVNGQEAGFAADGRSQVPMNVPEFLACKNFQYVSIEGYVDEFAIYDHALSAGRVAAHWAASGR